MRQTSEWEMRRTREPFFFAMNQRACYAKVVSSKIIKQLIVWCLNNIE